MEQTLASLATRRAGLADEAEKAKSELESVEAEIETLADGAGDSDHIAALETAVEAAEALLTKAEADAGNPEAPPDPTT